MVKRFGVGMAVVVLLAACSGNPTTLEPTITADRVPPTDTEATTVDETPSAGIHLVCTGKPTLAQTEGPYYTPGSPERSSLLEADTVGEPLILTGRVLTSSCEPIEGAVVDVWQADGRGEYDNVGFGLRGRVTTDADGSYGIETVVPGVYPGRTPHIHIKVFAPDGRELLTTQIYLPGLSEQIPDGIFSEELLARDLPPDAQGTRRIEFELVVAGT